MNIVTNSSPLIFLSKIGRLHVLEKLFDKVYIAQAVYNETVLSAKSDDITGQITQSILSGHFIRFNVENELAVKAISGRLHPGEAEAIIGALELGVGDVIIDDLHARNKAKQLSLNVTGTLGILRVAYRQGIIDDFEADINMLVDSNFRIAPNLIQQILSDLKKI